ncbi:MAG: glucosamine-6-phosphate deaminase [Verrucomicrobiia bacterium]
MPANRPFPSRTFTAGALAVRIYESHDTLAADAAARAHACLRDALVARGEARAIFASAASQVKFLEALTAMPGLNWHAITLFHMDEYLGVTDQHPASFRRFMRERVEARVHPAAFHYVEGEALEPIKECDRYAELLEAGPIDLCCLGIGENGHIAFNDPPVADFHDTRTVKLVKLDEACRRQQVGEGAFPTFEDVPQYAYSLTIPALCAARTLLCVVPERRKAHAVKAAIQGPISTACPSSILRQQPHATLFLDLDSASLL